jgi:glycosyltransferase involved in cell wall biosynthesis
VQSNTCILLVGHYSGQILYGAEQSFLDNLKSLVSLGHSVSVIIPSDENPEYICEILKYTDQILYLGIPWHIAHAEYDEIIIRKICDFARLCNAQLIISNTVTLREPLIAARRIGIPAVCSAREVPIDGSNLVKILKKKPKQIIDEIRRESDYVIANSKFTLNQYYLDGKSAIVRNTFDERLLFLEKNPSAHLIVSYVGSISEEKGFLDYVAIARHFEGDESVRFQVYGMQNEFLEDLKSDNWPRNLELKGYVGDKREIYQNIDILLQLSKLEESFSRVTLEAMSAATVVISYKTGAVYELITDESTGYLVEEGNLPHIEKLISALSENREILERVATSARKFAQLNFSASGQREDFRKVLGILLPDGKRALQSRDDFQIEISDLNRSHFKDPFFVGNRARLGTTTCVRFLGADRIAVASLLGQQMHLYKFDFENKTSRNLNTVDTTNGKALVSVDLFDFNGTNRLITANCEDSSLSFFDITPDAITFSSVMDVSTSVKNYVHGARFIPGIERKVAACVNSGDKGVIFFDSASGKRRGFFSKNGWGVKDMSMLDSHSRKFVVVMTKNNVGQDQAIEHEIQILLVQGNRRLTRFKVLSEYQLPNESIEGIIVRNGYLLATCQSSDSIFVFSLHNDVVTMIDELLGFSFPHGVDISPDGKLLAVSNYGSCSVTLRKISFPTTLGKLEIT